jgi:hypothetical protein
MRRPSKAKGSRKAVAQGPMLEFRKRFIDLAGDARKSVASRVRPLEHRVEAARKEVRRVAAEALHELARQVTRLEKSIAPPPARRQRLRSKKKVRTHPVVAVELPRARAAPGDAAA